MWIVAFAVILAALASRGGAFAPVIGISGKTSSAGPLFLDGDGNPPPFGNWGASAPAAPSWGHPAAPPVPAPAATGMPPDFSSWGQQSTAPAPAPSWQQTSFEQQLAVPATATAPPPPSTAAVSGGDPIATLAASQKASVAAICSAIPDLTPKPDLSWTSEPLAGSTATLEAYEAPGQSNVAWLSSLTVDDKISSLTVFNGPLTDVPHLLSRCCLVDGALQLALDFRPRAYGAYELKGADGGYPGPEQLGRKAFEYSGARNGYFSKFATDEVHAWLVSSAASLEGAAPLEQTDLDRLTGGPEAVALSMPATDHNVAVVSQMRERAAAYWLQWARQDAHEHRPGAPVNTQYVYDAKFRQNAYSALLAYYQSILGAADGAKLAAAESGPLDEAYVGGGS